MVSPRDGSPRRPRSRRLALWAGLVVGGLLPTFGCQVEYAGMTLPSGKYMYDDVQYFPPGPNFPWANTNAATQRARMEAMGYDTSTVPIPGAPGAGVMSPPPAEGALAPSQNIPNAPTNVNVQLIPPGGNVVGPAGEGLPPGVPAPGPMPPAGEGVPTEMVPPPGGIR